MPKVAFSYLLARENLMLSWVEQENLYNLEVKNIFFGFSPQKGTSDDYPEHTF